MKRTWVSLVALVGMSCGGSVAGSANVTGTIAGRSVPARNAVFHVDVTTTQGQTITGLDVTVTTYANACGCTIGPSFQVVGLQIGALGTVIAPGKYTLGPNVASNPESASAQAKYVLVDPTLKPCCETMVDAVSGSIDITALGATEASGDFDLSFPSGDHLTGTFIATSCAAVAPAADAGTCN